MTRFANLLVDPGFELGGGAWGSGAWPGRVTGGEFVALQIDSTDAPWQQSRPHALFVTAGPTGGEATIGSQSGFPVTPGAGYGIRFRAMMLGLGSDGYLGLKIVWRNAANATITTDTFKADGLGLNVVDEVAVAPAVAGGWPSDAATARVLLSIGDSDGGSTSGYLDDVRFGPTSVSSARVLAPRALELLEMLPFPLRSQPHFQASAAAQADQLDKLDAAIDALRGLVIPKSSGDYLYLWESIVGITTDPDAPHDQRLDAVLAFLSRMGSTGSGSDWVAIANRLIGTGWTYATYVGTSDPPARSIYVYLNSVSGGLPLQLAQRLFDEITPANRTVTVFDATGMALDSGLLDQDALG